MRLLPRTACLLVVTLGTFALSAHTVVLAGAGHEVRQQDGKFAVETLEIQAGDTVAFSNGDKVRHNVMTSAGPEKFNLGVFGPGEMREHAFTQPGSYEVRCGIHPRMKLAVTVR
jgi:plastocyanin